MSETLVGYKMTEKVTIDLITYVPEKDEYALYLVEEGPWDDASYTERLRNIQSRIYNTVDVAIDGLLLEKYPDLKGKDVRIQVSCYDSPSKEIEKLVNSIGEYISESDEYKNAIRDGGNVASVRLVYKEGTIKDAEKVLAARRHKKDQV